ncbi:hypothetical protein EV401DRAFT_2065812 [Pisolithus croceorrhizus]|nr:hypothetical protein EV401DRAFT_2065812 [Pisolithus croceorrhizus]
MQAVIKDVSSKLENSLVAAISPQVAKILSAANSLKDTNQKLESTVDGIPRNSGPATPIPGLQHHLHPRGNHLPQDTGEDPHAISPPQHSVSTTLWNPHHCTPLANLTTDLTRAHAAIKDRKILLDPDHDHPTIKGDMKKEDLIKLLMNAVDTLESLESPKLQLKSVTCLQIQGIILKMNSHEAANWLRNPTNRTTFINKPGGKIRLKDRLYHVVVPFFPISTI